MRDHDTLDIYRLKLLTGTIAEQGRICHPGAAGAAAAIPGRSAGGARKGPGRQGPDRRPHHQAAGAGQEPGRRRRRRSGQDSRRRPGRAQGRCAGQASAKTRWGQGKAKDAVATIKAGIAKGVDDKNNAQIRLGMAYISAGQKADAQKAFDAVKAAHRPTSRRWLPISGRSTRADLMRRHHFVGNFAMRKRPLRPGGRFVFAASATLHAINADLGYRGSMRFLTPDEIEALLLSLKISSVAVAAALPFAVAAALLLSRSFRRQDPAGRHRASAAGAAAGGGGFHSAGAVRHPRRRWAPSSKTISASPGVPLDRRGSGQRHFHLSLSGARHPAGAGSAGHRPGRSGAHPGRRLVRPAVQHHLAAGAAGAGRGRRSPPLPARWANSAPSSPSSPTFPARPGPCRWRSTPRCRRRAAKPKRRGCRRCPFCWRFLFMLGAQAIMRRATEKAGR